METLRARRADGDAGFSLVELLVVITILAILASIAIPVYVRQRERALKAQVESALKNTATALEAWYTDNGGDYSGTTADELRREMVHDEGLAPETEVVVTIRQADSQRYCLEGEHTSWPGTTFFYDSDDARPQEGTCV